MIASALRYEIERHAVRVRASNPLYLAAAAGRVSPVIVERYLTSLRFIVASTPACLARATARARALGNEELIEYFDRKSMDEVGHDQWAESDIASLRSTYVVRGGDHPVPAIAELLEFLERTIDEEPLLYVAYILWAEYFPVLVGGEMVAYLVHRCGVPASAMTCLAKHVQLDEEHAADDMEVLDALVMDPRLLGALRIVLQRSMAYFDRACHEMMEAELAKTAC